MKDPLTFGVRDDKSARRAYVTPQLTVYGPLVELTASGSAGPSESVGSTMVCTTAYKFHQNCVG